MRDIQCIAPSGHPGTVLDGAGRPWGRGDVRTVPSMTAATLVDRYPTRFAVVDRVIRGSVASPVVPRGTLETHHRALVAAINRGDHDTYLGPMREQESAGADRPSVIEAIDARSREVGGGA